jgi:pimeloyl-ACP methyl ester carboxylesterase
VAILECVRLSSLGRRLQANAQIRVVVSELSADHDCDANRTIASYSLTSTLSLKEVDVAGHDWGAAVAAVYALRHRQEVKKLGFIESAVSGAGFESVWVFSQPNPAMTFIPFLLGENLAEALVAGREEIFLRHLWLTFTYNKTALPFEDWSPYVEPFVRSHGNAIHCSRSDAPACWESL